MSRLFLFVLNNCYICFKESVMAKKKKTPPTDKEILETVNGALRSLYLDVTGYADSNRDIALRLHKINREIKNAIELC